VARRLSGTADQTARGGGLVLVTMLFVVFLVAPMAGLVWQSLLDRNREFVGLANYRTYFTTPDLVRSALNTLRLGAMTCLIVVPLSYAYAYALSHTRMRFKPLFAFVGLLPLLAPSLLPAIALIYIFGNHGFLRGLLGGISLYGPFGLTVSLVFSLFPHVLLIQLAAMERADGRLYESASSLRAGPWRAFLTVTLPASLHGIVSAGIVAFVFAITDFGAAKVIGGWYSVLSVDIYRKVIGQSNLGMGAVVSMVLFLPVALVFVLRIFFARRARMQFSPNSVPYHPPPRAAVDAAATLLCATIALVIVGIVGTGAFSSFVTFWPYDLSLSLKNYRFPAGDLFGWTAFRNSLVVAASTAAIGTAVVFGTAYLVETSRCCTGMRRVLSVAGMTPLAIPGMMIGIGYIFFFGNPSNPLNFLYNTLGILVASTVVHYYPVPHLAAIAVLRNLDAAFEDVAATLKVPAARLFATVIVPLCLPTLLNVFFYYFVCAMTTVSAVVFLWGPGTHLASLAVLSLEDKGEVGSAAAMAMMIVYASAAIRLLQGLIGRLFLRRSQLWSASAAGAIRHLRRT
jgi:iron(III) transport system permease protein